MNIRIDITDNSKAVLAALISQIEDALNDIGSLCVDYARKNIVRAKRVDTGELRDSIKYSVQSDGVYIGTNSDHAKFIEFGTGKHTKKHSSADYGITGTHFLHNAASSHTAKYKSTVEEAMKK